MPGIRICITAALLITLCGTHLDAQQRPASPVVPTRELVNGIVVLTHRADAFTRAPQWSIAAEPIATAGGVDAPDFDLTNVAVVELLTDGRLVTLARIGSRLLVFRADGRGEQSLGRQGKGPGEMVRPTGLVRAAGDTILVPDAANNRINWVVPGKGFIHEKPLPVIPNGQFIHPVGVMRSGALVLSTGGLVQNATADTVTRPVASIMLYSPRTDSASIVATIPDLELVQIATRYRGRPNTTSMPLRFSRRALAVAWDTVIATGSGDGYRIDLRDAAGRVRSSLQVQVPRRPVTKAIRDSAVAASLRRFEGQQAERMVDPAESRRIEQAQPVADSLPPYQLWFVSPNRTLWVVDAIAPNDTKGAATAFRQDGAIVGRLQWSRSGYPIAFGDDRVVFRDADADGVVSLKVFRIRR